MDVPWEAEPKTVNDYPVGQEEPPEPFVRQVKDALEHLYDFPYLQRHTMTSLFADEAPAANETLGQHLRRRLVAAIETLNPGPDVAFRDPRARQYGLMLLHYVEGTTIQEAARELGISRRQAHRDLRHGEESLAIVLWAQRPPDVKREALLATELSSMQAEMALLSGAPRLTDIGPLLQRAKEAVDPLAHQRAVTLVLDIPEPAPAISTDEVAARQVLVNLFSYAISQAEPGLLQIQCEPRENRQTIRLTYTPQPNTSAAALAADVIGALIEHLDWRLEATDDQGGMREVTIWMTARCSTILVIDDNEGLVALLQDYLSGHMCRVVSATEGDEGLRMAQRLMPDAIVLDVMMPGMDGWELLQRLRNHPATGNVPVVVCSVIKNPNLAFSLGATDFLAKPVSRDDVLNALRALGAA